MIDLKKRFTIGLTLMMENNEYKSLIEEFHPYIREIYFSPPLGREFQTRDLVNMDEPASKGRIIDIMKFAASYDIEGDFLLNSWAVPGTPSKLVDIYNEYRREFPVPRITLINVLLANTLKQFLPDVRINISFNADINSSFRLEQLSILGVNDDVVIGRRQMRDFALMREAKECFNFGVHLLINNGCIFDCISSCRIGGYCDFYIEKLVQSGKKDLNEIYAWNSIFPEELHRYFDKPYIDVFKLSTRDSTYSYMRDLLASYIEGRHRKDIHLYGRITAFTKYAKLLDFDRIFEYKRRIYETLQDEQKPDICSDEGPELRARKSAATSEEPVLRVWAPPGSPVKSKPR